MNEISKKKVLLHVCCAPCSASAVKMLSVEYGISFYWYNPNIYNEQEYKDRKDSAIRYAKELNISFREEEDFLYNYENWKNKSLEQCHICYTFRLEKTAIFAKQNNFDFFTTSLLSSLYQKHDLIKQIANDLADKYKINFLYCDFRFGFYEGKNLLRQKGYYIQKYCACNKSYRERFDNK
ncbi:MAG: epoxyqueuosine reductase QueH [Endomicrobium sp.]|uniref:epoxyqueuosine reductase QueH n=1 Tax=Candidatus Endomicrobiellum pyrsonymphae TaxID=1408203 RepID=UPI0035813EC4|nr:epoxyqueuosine reductase QueH [Endomicrobium sp.]